jgi:nicotinamidase-related amidase
MSAFTLSPSQTILLIVDMQEKIFASVAQGTELLKHVSQVIQGFQILHLPILQSEQYPQGLGPTVSALQTLLGEAYHPWVKSTFSCVDDPNFFNYMISLPYQHWVVVGIEAHVCVLQTAKGLLKAGKQVVVLYDAISSRSLNDYSMAMTEMRDAGVRLSGVETVLFELLNNAQHPQFKSISHLIKVS